MTPGETLRLVRRLVAINSANSFAYTGDFVFFMLRAMLGPVIAVLVWRATLASGAELPVDGTYLTTYFVLLGAISMLTSSMVSVFMAEAIRMGELSIWLVRPGSFLYEMAANNVAEKGFKALVLAPMIGVLGWFLRDSFSIAMSFWRWASLATSVFLAALLVYALDVIFGSLAFWIDDVSGVERGRSLASLVFAGRIVPLVLMPEWTRGFMDVQPFRFTVSFPLEMLVGNLSRDQLVAGFGAQIGYLVLFSVLARWIWRRGLRSYIAVGA